MKKKYPEGTAIPSGYEIEKFLKISVLLTQSNQNRINNQFTNTRKMLQMYKEIAEQLDISEKAVERNIYFALKFIKKNLNLFIFFITIP